MRRKSCRIIQHVHQRNHRTGGLDYGCRDASLAWPWAAKMPTIWMRTHRMILKIGARTWASPNDGKSESKLFYSAEVTACGRGRTEKVVIAPWCSCTARAGGRAAEQHALCLIWHCEKRIKDAWFHPVVAIADIIQLERTYSLHRKSTGTFTRHERFMDESKRAVAGGQ